MFVDSVIIQLSAGRGGNGVIAWHRAKYIPKGGPAGGDGGHGGTVYLQASPELSTLVEFRFKRRFAAESGKPGGTSNKSGRSGDDLIIPVPVGTLVRLAVELGEVLGLGEGDADGEGDGDGVAHGSE